MKERINWIDWAKALAVCSVVFCHLPQSQEWFYYRYLQALTMVIFFFISKLLFRLGKFMISDKLRSMGPEIRYHGFQPFIHRIACIVADDIWHLPFGVFA